MAPLFHGAHKLGSKAQLGKGAAGKFASGFSAQRLFLEMFTRVQMCRRMPLCSDVFTELLHHSDKTHDNTQQEAAQKKATACIFAWKLISLCLYSSEECLYFCPQREVIWCIAAFFHRSPCTNQIRVMVPASTSSHTRRKHASPSTAPLDPHDAFPLTGTHLLYKTWHIKLSDDRDNVTHLV